MIFPGFVGSAYTAQSYNVDCETLMNWYVERSESPNAKVPNALMPTPGFTEFASLVDGPMRGTFNVEDRLFAVGGGTLYELNNLAAVTSRGSVVVAGAPVTWATNGVDIGEVFVVSGTTGYIFNLSANTLTSVVSDVQIAGYLDGYFLALDPVTSELKVSDLLDGTTWDPTMVAARTAGPDRWVSMIVVHRLIWLLGSQTSEVWYNNPINDFPFSPDQSGFMEYGCAAAFSVAVVDNAPTWLGSSKEGSGIVVRADGYTPRRISTYAVERAIQSYDRIDDAEAFTYQDQGHSFYILTFPSAEKTWAYDAATGEWAERGYRSATTNEFLAYRPRCHAYAYGQHLVGDRLSSTIYTMSVDTATDMDGSGIRRVRRLPHLNREAKQVFYSDLQVDLEVGLGLSSGQGSDPQAMLRYSNDGGKTFSNELWADAGLRGAYKTRVNWHRLGRARDRVFEFSVSDPIPWRVAGAYLDARVGSS
jgi:hypothetical protein